MRKTIGIVILLFMPLLLTGCSLKKQPSKTSTATPSALPRPVDATTGLDVGTADYFSVEPTAYDAALRQSAILAEEKAKLWRPDATLHHVAVRLPANYEAGKAIEVYTYGSATEAYDWWTITFSGVTGKSVRAVIPKEDYLGTIPTPVPVKFWQVQYIEALQLADSNGGSVYRTNHPGAAVSATLAVGEPKQYLWWTIEYTATGSDSLKILVNPSTKEVVSADGLPLSTISSPSGVLPPASPTEEVISE